MKRTRRRRGPGPGGNWRAELRRWKVQQTGAHVDGTEAHPILNVFENESVRPGELRLTYPYWEHPAPLTFEVKGSYADPDADVGDETEHSWDHGLGA